MKPLSLSPNLIQAARPFAGPFCMLSSAIIFTLMNVMVKTMDDRYTVWHLGFFRFIGGVILMNLLFYRGTSLFRGNNIPLLIIRGFVGSVAFISLIMSIRMIPLSTSIIIFYTFPVFAAISAFILYRERICLSQAACIALVVLGIAVLFNFNISGSLTGQAMALVAAVFAGMVVTLVRTLRKTNGSVIIYLYFCTIGLLVTLPMVIVHPVVPASSSEWLMIMGIILTSAGAQLLMNQGFYYCSGWEGGIYMSFEAVFTAVTGILIMGEAVSWNILAGGMLILGSGVLLNVIKHKP